MPYAKLLDCTIDQYHADPCEVPSLNQSTAKIIVTESPFHAAFQHPRLGAAGRAHTKAKDKGSVIHSLLLGKGEENLVICKFDSFRSNDAKAARDKALLAGKTPIIQSEYDDLTAAVGPLRERLLDFGVDLSSESAKREQAVEWDKETDNGIVRCRGMYDYVDFGIATILDPKSSSSRVTVEFVVKQMINMGYDVQEAAYTESYEALHPETVGHVRFGFLFLELEPPYGVLPVYTSTAMKQHGKSRWDRAANLWAQCTASGKWPSYSKDWTMISPPTWAMAKELENEIEN